MPSAPVEVIEHLNDTSDVITKTIVEQKKYTEKIIDAKIAAAMATLQSSQTMVLGTVDTGEPHAIWIDYGT